MSGYVTVNRLSLVQLYTEERKHRAHLKKIAEMQRRSGLDNTTPTRFPHVAQHFSHQTKAKNKQIAKENNVKSKKLIDIMKSKTNFQSKNEKYPTNQRSNNLHSTKNTEFFDRISKTKSVYDTNQWQKGYEEHKEHLKLIRHSKLFTPRDLGINLQRIKAMPVSNSKRPTPASSTLSLYKNQK